ncbi:MAG: HEAT repeat domain-containing protein [Bradymonadaceae bacterium]
MKLFTDVSKLALLRPLGASRRRLLGSAAAALAVAYSAGLLSAHYILESSESVGLNIALVTADMFLVLVASFLTTAAVADLTFPGDWREAVFLGRQHESPERAPVERRDGEFMVLLLIAIAGNALGVNYAAGGFIDRYHTSGYFRVRMRSNAAADRVAALDEIGADMSFKLWNEPRVRQLVRGALDDPSPRVRARAAWTLGKIDDREARDELLATLTDDPAPSVRGAAATALGKLGFHDQTRRRLEAVLAETDDTEVAIGVLRGLGLMAAPDSVPAIVEQFDAESTEVAIHAFWAARKIGSSRARDRVRDVLEDGTRSTTIETSRTDWRTTRSTTIECAAYDTLKKVATDRDVTLARRAYQRADADLTCETRLWVEPDGTEHRLVIGDSFKVKMLKIVANRAAFEHESWFQRIASDESEPDRVRQVASAVLRQIRRANTGP